MICRVFSEYDPRLSKAVQAAGLMSIKDGKILSFDDQSGHFRPSSKSMDKVAAALRKLYNKNHNLFSDEFNWRKQ